MTAGVQPRPERLHVPDVWRAEVRTDRAALEDLGPALDDLHTKTGCPVTARRPWLQVWLDHYPLHEPLLVTVCDGTGRLRAAAPLAVVRRRGWFRVVPLGDGPSDEVRLPATDADAAQRLAGAVHDALRELGRPWLLVARQLDADGLTVRALAEELPWSRVLEGEVSPRLRFQPDRSLRAHVSRNHHQQTRRMRNRLSRDGLVPQVDELCEPQDVTAVWPELERICRARDLQLRGASGLDDPRFRAFFRDVVAELATRDEVRLTTLRLGGALAAYVLSFQDGDTRRMWSCRLDPALQDYGVGRLANDAALAAALADPTCTSFDWMRGEESYKASMSDHVVGAADLIACSHAVLWGVLATGAGLRSELRRIRDRDDRVGRLVSAVTPALRRVDPFS